ncbi:hypothetical protein DV735_g5403, partial [Chaetothyriales sp. CBS 134920]
MSHSTLSPPSPPPRTCPVDGIEAAELQLMPGRAGDSAYAKLQERAASGPGSLISRGGSPATVIHQDDKSPAANQFGALSTASLVQYSSDRAIEALSATRVKIRGSGHLGLMLGTATLFVKRGAVSICGAILPASTRKVNIYSPRSHTLPAIEASLVAIGFPDVWRPLELDASAYERTFHILGYHFTPDPSYPKRYTTLNTHDWNPVLTELAEQAKSADTSTRILVHGPNNSGVSTFAQNLLNRLVNQADPAVGVAFVDLEADRPAFTPPGTIALQQVKIPVFGPPYTRPAANSGPLSKMHYVGIRGSKSPDIGWHYRCALDLLDDEARKGETQPLRPVIIHAPKWLSRLRPGSPEWSEIWDRINPTHVVYLGDSDGVSIPSDKTVYRLEAKRVEQYDMSRQADMSLQAYFHMVVSREGERLFNCAPVVVDQLKTHSLSFYPYGIIKGVILDDQSIAPEDVAAAITGKIVAVFAVSSDALDQLGYDDDKATGKLCQFDGNLNTLPLSPAELGCIGFGFVRAVKERAKYLTLTTPIPAKLLNRAFSHGDKGNPQLILAVSNLSADWLLNEAK